MLLHDAVAAGRLSPNDPLRVGCFGEHAAELVRLTAVPEHKGALHAAVASALGRGEGWEAAMLLEGRSELLHDADDVALCQAAVAWCEQHKHDTDACPAELRAHVHRR